MRRAMLLLAALLACCALGCKHDLAALRSATSSGGGVRDSGTPSHLGTGGSGSGGQGGSAGASDGGSGSGSVSPAACEPCPDQPDAGAALGLRACCRGTDGSECGLTFGMGQLCLQRMAPGQPSNACPSMGQGALSLDGCCRPDDRCGLDATGVELGCVAREEILVQIGAPRADPMACQYTCQTDDDCASATGFVCAEDPKDSTHKRRICVKQCLRDQDCVKGLVCALGNDVAMDRVLAFCQPPVGNVAPGAYCSAAQDCVNGVCLQLQGMDPFCTQLCRNPADCPSGRNTCFASSINTPAKDAMQTFHICGP